MQVSENQVSLFEMPIQEKEKTIRVTTNEWLDNSPISYLEKYHDQFFQHYNVDELKKDIRYYQNGDGRLYKTLGHFFEEVLYKCCGKSTKVSPYECLQDNQKMKVILDYIESKPNFFSEGNEFTNVKKCFQNSMSWVRQVANFPCKEARNIYFRYLKPQITFFGMDRERLNCLDTSCGFGSRMSAVLLSGENYFGIDPNEELQNKLHEYYDFLKSQHILEDSQVCDLRTQGSEVFIDEWEGKMDVMFTSPPYFNLEKYSNDNYASTKNYNDYKLWVENYVKPTIQNVYRYLRVGGVAMINIKNLSPTKPCYDDFFKAFQEIKGFKYIETFNLTIAKKSYGIDGSCEIDNHEPIMAFSKEF